MMAFVSRDLETIVTCMEIAALTLTDEPDRTFTFDRFMEEITAFAGDEIIIDKRDVEIVIGMGGVVKRVGRELRLK